MLDRKSDLPYLTIRLQVSEVATYYGAAVNTVCKFLEIGERVGWGAGVRRTPLMACPC